MMHAYLSSNRKERGLFTVSEQHLGSLDPARRLGSRPRNSRQRRNFLATHRQFKRLSPSGHGATPRWIVPTRNPRTNTRFQSASFMESVVTALPSAVYPPDSGL